MRFFKILLLALILFLSSNLTAHAEETVLNIPISSNGFLKEYWDPKFIWSAGYLSMGNDNSVYKDYRTRIMLMYKLFELRSSGIGIGDINKVNLNLWYYHTERNSPAIYNFYIHPYDGSVPKYSYWPEPPLITENTLERSIEKKSGVKEIDITDLIKTQLRDENMPQGLQMNLVNESQLAIWFYSSRCANRTLYYGPQCEPHMIPTITALYENEPPSPVSLITQNFELTRPEPLLIEWSDSSQNFYSIEISNNTDFDQNIFQSDYSSEKEFIYTPEDNEDLFFRIKNKRNLESDLEGISEIGTISFKTKGSDNAPFDPITDTPIEDPPPVDTPGNNKPRTKAPSDKTDEEKNNFKDVKGEETKNKDKLKKDEDKAKNVNPTCFEYQGLLFSNKIVCEGIKLIIKKIERIAPNLIELELSLPKEVKFIQQNSLCKNQITSSHCKEKVTILSPPILYTAKYDDREIDIYKLNDAIDPTILIKSTHGETNGSLKILAHYFISETFVSIESESIRIPDYRVITHDGDYRFPFKNNIGVTQWHGYTAYSNPHTGIDFGANEEEVYALADGAVTRTGYDNYYGKCNSGGYYISIKHSDNRHSVYFHLDGDSIKYKKGDKISKGDLLATSGNSGAFNCQPLAKHLHMETRLNRSQESHTDPVKLINYDWSSVHTLEPDRFPGRLTGDNPHPGW